MKKITISSVPDAEQERVSIVEDGVFHGIQRCDRHRDDGAQPKEGPHQSLLADPARSLALEEVVEPEKLIPSSTFTRLPAA